MSPLFGLKSVTLVNRQLVYQNIVAEEVTAWFHVYVYVRCGGKRCCSARASTG